MQDDRISDLTKEVTTLSGLLRDLITENRFFRDTQLQHSVALWGEKGEPEKGLTIRLDRIEQAQHARSKVMWIFGTAIGGVVIERVWHIFINAPK